MFELNHLFEIYIINYEVVKSEKNKANLLIILKYNSGNPVISSIERISKPGRRIFSRLTVEENFAVQEVVITTSNGERIGYRFRLSIQKGPVYPDCWMTDSVVPFKVMEV